MQAAEFRLHGDPHAAHEGSGLNGLATEKHFTPNQVAERWGLSPSKVRRIFVNEPGVLLTGEPSRRVGRILKRGYWTMRIPESVVERVHRRLASRSRRAA